MMKKLFTLLCLLMTMNLCAQEWETLETQAWVHEWRTMSERFEGSAQTDGTGAYKIYVRSEAQALAAGNMNENDGHIAQWDSQFFVTFGEENALKVGDVLSISFSIKADAATTISTQSHAAPGAYLHWAAIGDVGASTSWKEVSRQVTVTGENNTLPVGTYSIAFNLSDGQENNVYFKDFVLKVKHGEEEKEITWTNIIVNSDLSGKDMSCFYQKVYPAEEVSQSSATDGAIVINSPAKVSEEWETGFYIVLPQILPAGTKFKVSFKCKASATTTITPQCHNAPDQYIYWNCFGEVPFSTEWATFATTAIVPEDCDGSDYGGYKKDFKTICFNLPKDQDITYYFDNIVVAVDKDIAVNPQPFPVDDGSVGEPAFPDGSYYMMNANTGIMVAANGFDNEGARITFAFDANAGYTITGSNLFAGKTWIAEGDGFFTFSTLVDGVKKYAAVDGNGDFTLIEDGTADGAFWFLLTTTYWEEEFMSYNVAGTADLCGVAWDANANKMTKNTKTGLFEWTVEDITVSAEATPAFKIAVNNTENEETVAWYPEDENVLITTAVTGEEGIFNITITFNNVTKEIGVTAVKTGDITMPDLVVLPAGVEPEDWALEGFWGYDNGRFDVIRAIEVAFDGNDVYVQGLAFYFWDAWLKGTLNTETGIITFPSGQFVGQDASGNEYMVGYNGDFCDIQYEYDAEAKTLTQLTPYILESKTKTGHDEKGYPSYWGFWIVSSFRAGEPVEVTPVTAPEGLETETYVFTASCPNGDEWETYAYQIQVGFDGKDVYLKGFSDDISDMWAKGTLSEDGKTVTIPAKQYLGHISSWTGTYDFYLTAMDEYGAYEDIVLAYDAETNTFSTNQTIILNGSMFTYEPYQFFKNVEIIKMADVAATPADPSINDYKLEGVTYPYIEFVIPTQDTEGNELLTSKLFYIVWIEQEEVEQPFTVIAAQYRDVEEDWVEIPYEWDDRYDIYKGGSTFYFNPTDAIVPGMKIGIQSIYYGGGVRNTSNIVWMDKPVGINHVNAETDNKVVIFDLQGRRVTVPTKGLYIVNGKKVMMR